MATLYLGTDPSRYTESDSKIGQWQGGALNLSQAKPTSKQLNLHSPSDADGLKVGGCPTQPEPIFESRAVYPHTGVLVHYPVIQTIPIKQLNEIDQLRANACTHWLFTSPHAVKYWSGLQTSPAWKTKTVVAIGPATAALLKERGVLAKQPACATQEGLIAWLAAEELRDAYVGWPRSALARPLLETYFQRRAFRYLAIDLYTTICRRIEPIPDLSLFDELVFTSPSTVRAFVEIFGSIPVDKKIVSIGPVTRETIEKITKTGMLKANSTIGVQYV